MLSISFYQGHLDRVSRSFAVCIQQLHEPMRQWVSLSYLLCRVLDTVEDALWEHPPQRTDAFLGFDRFVQQPDSAGVASWIASFPRSLPEGERLLLADACLLFTELDGLPTAPREAIRTTVCMMSRGMQHYAEERDVHGTLHLHDLTDVNRYCYFVAGTVGYLLTRLFVLQCHRTQAVKVPQPFMKNAFHFGLFLQKINLLKDQRQDEHEGRYLVPDRAALLASLRENLAGSIAYLTALPIAARDYRVFCAWALFLGVHSLPHIQAAYAGQDAAKMDRAEAANLMCHVADIIDDNTTLRAELFHALARVPAVSEITGRQRDWFFELSGDALRPSELSELCLF